MSNGISDEAIAAYAADLIDLEGRINELQDDKKATYASVRDAFGKRTADALKLAIKRYRMDADKREAADEVDAEADRFLSIIRSPRAPRATRTREIIEEFGPETGEVLQSSQDGTSALDHRSDDISTTSLAGAEGDEDRQPTHAPRYEAAE